MKEKIKNLTLNLIKIILLCALTFVAFYAFLYSTSDWKLLFFRNAFLKKHSLECIVAIAIIIDIIVFRKLFETKHSWQAVMVAPFSVYIIFVCLIGIITHKTLRVYTLAILALLVITFLLALKFDKMISALMLITAFGVCSILVFSFVLNFTNDNRKPKLSAEQYQVYFENYTTNNRLESLKLMQKIQLAQMIVDYEAVINNTTSARVTSFDFENGTSSNYDYKDRIIYIDTNNPSLSSFIYNTLYEYQHARQQYVVKHQPYSYEAEQIANNYRGYGHKYDTNFQNQYIEVDAKYFASTSISKYLEFFAIDEYEKSDDELIVKTSSMKNEFGYILVHNYRNKKDKTNDYIIVDSYTGENKYVTIPERINGVPVTEISSDFANSKMERLIIPSSVKTIPLNAFSEFKGKVIVDVSSVDFTIKNSCLIDLKENAILYCEKDVKLVEISEGIQSIAWDAFTNCNDLVDIKVDEKNFIYKDESGILYNKRTNALVLCPEGKAGIICIDKSCSRINSEAFLDCKKLTEITIPEKVLYIDSYAFSGCTATLNLSNALSIHPFSLVNCNACEIILNADTVVETESTASFETLVFNECDNLNSITIRNSEGKTKIKMCSSDNIEIKYE